MNGINDQTCNVSGFCFNEKIAFVTFYRSWCDEELFAYGAREIELFQLDNVVCHKMALSGRTGGPKNADTDERFVKLDDVLSHRRRVSILRGLPTDRYLTFAAHAARVEVHLQIGQHSSDSE